MGVVATGAAGGEENAGVWDTTLYLLYILQAAGVWFQGGGVLDHFVHCDDQEDEIELSKQSNGSVNTPRYTRGGGALLICA